MSKMNCRYAKKRFWFFTRNSGEIFKQDQQIITGKLKCVCSISLHHYVSLVLEYKELLLTQLKEVVLSGLDHVEKNLKK